MDSIVLDFFYCFTPGVLGGLPYWIIWPVRRRVADVVAMAGFFALVALYIAVALGDVIGTYAGSSSMLGTWGEGHSLALRILIGLAVGTCMGVDGRRQGAHYYPFNPLEFR